MIHKYSMDGVNIVLDIYSGAVHVVDDIVYDLIDYYKEKSKDELKELFKGKYELEQIDEAIEEIETLENEGLLFTEDVYLDYLSQFKMRGSVVKALCLHIAHDCNLKCKYCFAGEGGYRGSRSLMSKEVGIKAIDFLIEASGNRRNLEIDFWWGTFNEF